MTPLATLVIYVYDEEEEDVDMYVCVCVLPTTQLHVWFSTNKPANGAQPAEGRNTLTRKMLWLIFAIGILNNSRYKYIQTHT